MPWSSCYTIHNGQAKAIYARVSRPAELKPEFRFCSLEICPLFSAQSGLDSTCSPQLLSILVNIQLGLFHVWLLPFSVSLKCRSASMRRTAASGDASVATNTITENPFLRNPRQRILANDRELISSTWQGAITAHSCGPSSRDTLQTDAPHSWISVPLTTHTQGLHQTQRLLPSRPVAHLQNWGNFCLHPLKY